MLRNCITVNYNDCVHRSVIRRWISFFRSKKEEPKEEVKEVTLEEKKASLWEHLSEEEVMKIRDKSGLLPRHKEMFYSQLSEPRKFDTLYQYREGYVRRFYAKYGRQSGLKPGVAWPSKAKLEFIKQYENTFYPPLSKLFDDLKAEKAAKEKEVLDREKDVAERLKLLPKLKKEFFQKIEQREQALMTQKMKKEKLVQEIREYLGYDVDPHDVRFQEALQKKEEEDSVKAKALKKETKQQRLMARIAAMTAEGTEAKKGTTKISENTEKAEE